MTAPTIPTARPLPEGEPPPPIDTHGSDQRGRDGALVIVCVVAAVALIASIIGIGFGMRAIDESKTNVATEAGGGAAAATAGAPEMVDVSLAEFAVTPKAIEVAAGGMLMVTNKGTMQHNLAIEGQNLRTPMIDPNAEADLNLGNLAPGDYTVFCEVPGHREAGMSASLKVVAASGAAASSSGQSSAAGPTTPTTMSADQMDALMAARTKAFPAKTEGVGAQNLAPKVLADGTKEFDLTAKVVQWEVEPGKKVEAWTYNGTVPGPTIRVNDGDKVKVVLHNELPESTVIHFHGIEVPNSMDGVPDITQPPVKPGESFTYSFVAHGPAVGMYHSHHDAAKQVGNGLAGAFLIGHEPVPAGVTVAQEQIMMLNDTGTIGFSLNGKSFPATAPVVAKLGDWVEVHYMNEGVMIHPMHLHGLAQLVIAKDGYPVPQPYEADTIAVAPGERYTVLVHATSPGTWAWHCHILPHAEREDGMFGMVTAMVVK
jgi:FtsP/CotA-like multicopper oxidase with cupredoxin domain